MPTCLAIWEKVKPLMYYDTPKIVRIKDVRLGLSLYAMKITIVVYVLWSLITKQQFLIQEVPLGFVSPYSSGTAAFKQFQNDFYAGDTATPGPYLYCRNATYDYYFDEEFDYRNITCMYPDHSEVAAKGMGSFFFTTSFTQRRTVYVPAPPSGECPEFATCRGTTATAEEARLGRCQCTETDTFFTVGVEHLNLTFSHLYASNFGDGRSPKTYIRLRGSTQNLYEFPAGDPVSLTLFDWLRLSNVDLDDDQNQNVNNTKRSAGGSTIVDYPAFVRLAGAQMLVRLRYYNYNQWEGADKKVNNADAPTVCILEIEPQFLWTDIGSRADWEMRPDFTQPPSQQQGILVETYRYGIQFTFQAAGIISKFDYNEFINALVQGLVLIKFGDSIVKYMAMFLFGETSKMYKEFMKETVEYKREYARFATQAIVASYVFRQYDKDGSGYIDAAELKAILHSIFEDRLSPEELHSMTAYIMAEADLINKETAEKELPLKKGERRPDGAVSLHEFSDIFTEDKTSMLSLTRIMRQHHKSIMAKAAEEAEAKAAAEAAKEGDKSNNLNTVPMGGEDGKNKVDGENKV